MPEDYNKLLYEQTIIISELLIKVTALENIMLSKGIISSADMSIETKKVVTKLTELVSQNASEQIIIKN